MRFGFIPSEGGRLFEQSLREVCYAEELGFDSVWLEEHHGVKDHYWPAPLLCLAGYATRTSKLLLGTDVVVLPFYHPVRAAEDAAMLDVISGGRFILGVAIGYRPDEFALYNVPLERRGARYAEAINLIKQLWTEDDVTFEGRYGPTANLQKLLDATATYHQHLADMGKDPRRFPRPLTREVVIAETAEQARELAEKHLLVNYRDEYGGGWSHPLIGAEDNAPVDRLEELGHDRFIIGGPEQCVATIKRFQETFGVDHLICRMYFPGMSHEHIMRGLELLATEVMPAFRD